MKKLLMMIEELNNFLKIATASLDIHGNLYIVENVENMNDPVEKATQKIEFHPSIFLIKNKVVKNVSQNLFCLILSIQFHQRS